MLECRVLGPVDLLVDGTSADIGGVLPRRLVAALVLADGRPVPVDRLAQAMWDDQPPPKAPAALQAYVSRIRTALGPAHRDRLGRTSVGYMLLPDEVDATRFGALVESARGQLTSGRPEAARAQLTEALRLWRSEPYPELPADLVDAEYGRLTELRESAVEELAAARLAAGDAADAVVELEQLVRAQPFRERRWALLVVAMYRSDRQADALAALRRIRELLADQLGVDPGPELQDLEKQVPNQDPRLLLTELPRGAGATPVRRPLTSFLGRSTELDTLAGSLDKYRLVNLVGPAGVGKTRLAIEHLAVLPPTETPWMVRLADVPGGAGVAGAVAEAVGLVVTRDPAAQLEQAIGASEALLVLDNFEHVVPATAELAARLLHNCPGLRILGTSREPLGIDGEITIPIQPLAGESAVSLLVDRVQAVRPGWTPTEPDLAAARRVAAELDGLPLALELAAARARVLGLAEIADRLADRFALLGAVPRGSITSHDTLAAAIGWSIDLLEPADRELLLKLWAFEGGFTLEAAELIRPGAGPAVLESLSALVTRSVVVADTASEPTRYLLLESIREHCRQLDPDPDETRRLQALWVRKLAENCAEAVRDHRAGPFLRMMGQELPNLRAGFVHDLAAAPVAALRTAVDAGIFLYRIVNHTEAQRMLAAAIEVVGADGPALDRARALNSVTALTFFAGAIDRARDLIDTVVGILAEIPPDESPLYQAEALLFLEVGAAASGKDQLAVELADRLVAFSERHGLRGFARTARTLTGVVELRKAVHAGDVARFEAVVDSVLASGRGWSRGWFCLALGEAYLCEPGLVPDAPRRALGALRTALVKFVQNEDYPYILNVLRAGALALARTGRPEDGRRLLASVRAHAERLGMWAPGLWRPDEPWVEEELPIDRPVELSWTVMAAILSDD